MEAAGGRQDSGMVAAGRPAATGGDGRRMKGRWAGDGCADATTAAGRTQRPASERQAGGDGQRAAGSG
ncbi:hypothetical protein GCM10010112_33890 [Actinoplanes lobatus]|nr:hypothetical protein GCM10010112_33890 [Actinoplanes lobatus]